MRFITKIGQIWLLNILWLVTSLGLITIGASTTALIYSMMKLHADEGYPVSNFFKSFKENFGQATVIWLIYAAVGALLAWDLIYWNQTGGQSLSNVAWALSLAALLLYVISLSYVFAIQAKFVNPVHRTILFSLVVPFRNLKETLLILVTLAAVVYLNVATVFAVNFITINIGIGLIAYLFAVYYISVFRKYIPEANEESEEQSNRAEAKDAHRNTAS